MKTYRIRWRQLDKRTGAVIETGWELIQASTIALAESRYKRSHKNREVVFTMLQPDKPIKPDNYYE